MIQVAGPQGMSMLSPDCLGRLQKSMACLFHLCAALQNGCNVARYSGVRFMVHGNKLTVSSMFAWPTLPK